MALIEREDTPTPPEKKQRRKSSNRAEEKEDERPERTLAYTSIVDLQQRTVHAREYGYGDTTPVHHYQKIGGCLGAGTYGKVYEGKHKETGERVALKMMKITQDQYDLSGVPLSVIREINILKQLKHENIVSLIETCATRDFDGVFIVMEYCDTDLAALLDVMSHSFMEQQSKCLILQLLRALAYIHEMRFLHRDIKTSNILLKQDGILKLADFGLARAFNSQVPATPRVVTLWYRSMELLLGSKTQTEGVDIWPVGCIMGELLLHQPLFPHDSEFKMISAISDLLGSPTVEIWPDYPNMPICKDLNLNLNPHNLLAKRFEKHSLDAIDFMQRCFIYNPAKRMTAIQALEHPYFKAEPRACRPSLIPVIPRKAPK